MDYSDRLLNHGNFVTRLAHRRRLSTLFGLLSDRTYERALDLGCADGWLLDQLARAGHARSGVGVDTEPSGLEVARRRFEGRSGFEFVTPDNMEKVGAGSADLLICTETLEHVDDSVDVLAKLARWGTPGARLIVSVPIEVGPSLLVKQLGRFMANLVGPYGYEPYGWSELAHAGLLWNPGAFDSSHLHATREGGKGHKGFDFRRIRREVERFFHVDKALFTPFPFLGTAFNSTAFYVATLNRSS